MDKKEFYSQCGEDKWIFENLPLPENGVFLDIGAGDYKDKSNTYAFEKYLGWKGIAVDLYLDRAKDYIENRPSTKYWVGAVVPDEYPTKTVEMYIPPILNGELNRTIKPSVQEYEKYSCTIAASEANEVYGFAYSMGNNIDLLSIDVEGTEGEILSSIFKEYPETSYPTIIIAEHSTMWIDKKQVELKEICEKAGYKTVYETALNYIFVKR